MPSDDFCVRWTGQLLPPVSGEVRSERPNLRSSYLAQRQAFDDSYPLLARDVLDNFVAVLRVIQPHAGLCSA